jgi:hypothetical protein
MPNASEAILYYEADQDEVAITELTDQGDHKDFRSTDTLWSGYTGKTPTVTPNGVYDGGVIIPAVSGSNDVVDISQCRAYLAGVLTTVTAVTDEAIVRPSVDTHQIFSITITSGGAFAVVDGAEGTSFSTTRGANGGPPLVPATSIEIGWIKVDSQTPAAITTSEIKQIEGTSLERFDRPTWTVKYSNVSNGILGYAGILFNSALPTIHIGTVTKDVYASWYTPAFAEIIRAYDWVPPGRTISVNTTETYGETVGSVSRSIGAGSFTALTDTNIHDNILKFENQLLWFKYYQARLETSRYQLAQGYLAISQSNPAGDNISASFTLGAENVASMVYA